MLRHRTLMAALLLVAGPLLSAQQAGQTQPPAPAPSGAVPSGAPPSEASAPPAPAQGATATQAPTFRTGTELVTLDVGVVDRQGLPLRGLGPGDFVVTVAGQPRRVVSAEFVDTSRTPATVVTPPPTESSLISTNEGGGGLGRLVVFIVDQASLEAGSARQVSGAASRFLKRLTVADRSALMLMPVGPNVNFTWNHARVGDALARVSGLASMTPEWQFGSLSDARDIASRNPMALRNVAERECGGGIFTNAGLGGGQGPAGPGPGTSPAPGGGGQSGEGGGGGGGQGGGTQPSGGSGGSRGGGGGGGGSRGSGGGFGMDRCSRGIQMEAESMWRMAQMTSFASLTTLRQALGTLAHVRGDKTIVLISGGMPLDEREHMSTLSMVATEAAAARATLFTVFVPGSPMSVTRNRVTSSPSMDQQINWWPLETLAGMTGGGSFRADVGADGVFDRLGREMSGYYRLGVERSPVDQDGKGRRLKVEVNRGGLTVRSRALFDVRAYEDRNWTARLADALVAPMPATSVGVRITSYLAADPEGSGKLSLMLAGELDRLRPGPATFQVAVRGMDGNEVVSTEQQLGDVAEDTLPFTTNLSVDPGTYIVRFAVMDAAGRVGSVDHRVEARRVPVGSLSGNGPLLVRVPNGVAAPSRLSLEGVRQDERLALQIDLEGQGERPADMDVVFEIAAAADGPALVTSNADVAPGPTARSVLAQAVADVRVLPPGQYVARAKVKSGGTPLGELQRPFTVMEAPSYLPAGTAAGATTTTAGGTTAVVINHTATTVKSRAVGTVGPFAVEQMLSKPVVGAYLERLAARPDAASAATRELLERARNAALGELVISEALAKESPVAAPFLKGLALLAQGQLDPAAVEFRAAMRAGADFYPAMVYLGACYAAGGKDKEAAGAWRTALIREGDTVSVHLLLADALMRTGRGDLAMQALTRARQRWPEDDGLKRRFAVAAVAAGLYADGLTVVDELVARRAEDEPVLALALLVLYDAFVTGRPIDDVEQDRARMTRFADAYRARGGPSLALVDTWVAEASKRKR